MSAITYPPGVLTGRPMEMWEFHPTGAIWDIYAVPDQWVNGEKDIEILCELCEELDHLHEEEMRRITEQQQYLERFDDQTAYYMYPCQGWLEPFAGIKEALNQFEEDFDYEESLKLERIKNTGVNFHRFLATPPEDRPGWCGSRVIDLVPGTCDFVTLHKERYRFTATVIRGYPCDRKGYALAETVYGKIYIPDKFMGYIPGVGEELDATVALQDVAPRNKSKKNSFRFTAIYLH